MLLKLLSTLVIATSYVLADPASGNVPACGTIVQHGERLKRSSPSDGGQMPWHAVIYTKTTKPYRQICSGSLISTTIVISAAHCFWSDIEKQHPASDYAVAVGKEYRPWNDPHDNNAQKSDVKEIKIPPRFRGAAASYQDDISLVIVSTPFEYRTNVRPVCLDYDINFDKNQLQNGGSGRVPGWTIDKDQIGQKLKVVELNSMDLKSCIAKVPHSFIENITSDKICGEFLHDKISCRGNSGAGAVVPETTRGQIQYYLRGVLSTAPVDGADLTICNITLVALTHVLKHEHFITQYL